MTAHGAWLAALSRRLLHRDTFETMVSPAIADLETESASGWRTYLRHCAGLGVVFGAALLRDWRADVRMAFDFGARRDVWLVTAIWYLAPTVLLAGLVLKGQTPWHLLDASAWPAVVLEAVLGGRLYASYVAIIAAVFFLSRRLSPIKALVIGVATIAFAFALMNAGASVVRVPLNQTIHETAGRNLATSPSLAGDPSSWENEQWPWWVEAHGRQAERSATLAEVLGWFAIAPISALFNFLPFGLIGLALGRGRGTAVAVRLAAVLGTIVTIHLLTIKWDEENQFLHHLRQMGAITAGALFLIGVGPVARLIAAPFRTGSDWRPRHRSSETPKVKQS